MARCFSNLWLYKNPNKLYNQVRDLWVNYLKDWWNFWNQIYNNNSKFNSENNDNQIYPQKNLPWHKYN